MLTTYTAGEARSLVRQAKRPNVSVCRYGSTDERLTASSSDEDHQPAGIRAAGAVIRYTRHQEICEEVFAFLDLMHGIASTPMDIGSLGKSGKGAKGAVCTEDRLLKTVREKALRRLGQRGKMRARKVERTAANQSIWCV